MPRYIQYEDPELFSEYMTPRTPLAQACMILVQLIRAALARYHFRMMMERRGRLSKAGKEIVYVSERERRDD